MLLKLKLTNPLPFQFMRLIKNLLNLMDQTKRLLLGKNGQFKLELKHLKALVWLQLLNIVKMVLIQLHLKLIMLAMALRLQEIKLKPQMQQRSVLVEVQHRSISLKKIKIVMMKLNVIMMLRKL